LLIHRQINKAGTPKERLRNLFDIVRKLHGDYFYYLRYIQNVDGSMEEFSTHIDRDRFKRKTALRDPKDKNDRLRVLIDKYLLNGILAEGPEETGQVDIYIAYDHGKLTVTL
jgi:hypothetical protein